MTEIWKDIKGSENEYQISLFGQVKSFKRYPDGEVLKQKKCKNGYLHVALTKNKSPKYFRVHRLVADAFVDNPYNKPHVNHILGVKHDNYYKGLEWVTQSENNKHSYDTGLRVVGKGKDNHLSKSVVQLSLNGDVVKEYDSIADVCRVMGLKKQNISACCNGKAKTSGGYKWQFKTN